jgi:hypothetical protein
MSSRDEIRAGLIGIVPEGLADSLIDEFDEIIRRFDLGDFRPSELSGARFSEAAFRVCQHVCFGKHTSIGKSLPRIDKMLLELEQVPAANAPDSFRLHVPRALRVIYDLRNKRDVAHLGAEVSPNFADASLVLGIAGWVMAEILRICHACDIDTAQALVDNLVQRRTPLIWSEGALLRVLNPELSYRDQTLLVLHHLQPQRVDEQTLVSWLEYSTLSAFRRNILQRLHKEAMIDYRDGSATILPPGIAYVESELASHS